MRDAYENCSSMCSSGDVRGVLLRSTSRSASKKGKHPGFAQLDDRLVTGRARGQSAAINSDRRIELALQTVCRHRRGEIQVQGPHRRSRLPA